MIQTPMSLSTRMYEVSL